MNALQEKLTSAGYERVIRSSAAVILRCAVTSSTFSLSMKSILSA